ncbi:MAG TPA: acyl carrier protein [Chromatiaceae bacterium]|jgi:acyl carrier protein|nr:acyl carrier protein [Chromatiaceae bacterium]HIA09354.1 acyl carrier protein [Chromatiaceae bacterium]HIB84496.1 acyl carrier protein [Chromatiaceae bacterium]HIN82050.1 acyl carrier protein [Chromatiales bacterium]HIO54281.1 acyl carrier protein [Chromatiales bacterium]
MSTKVESKVIDVLHDMTQDWDLEYTESIGPGTGLMKDLAFESIDVVQLAVALEQGFDKQGMPFEELFMRDGDYVDELLVSDVVTFVTKHAA